MEESLNFCGQLGELPQKVAVVRALPGLGDFLCAVPALRALRASLPKAHIVLIGLPNTASLVERFSHYLNGWLEFPGYPGIIEVPFSPRRTVSFFTQAHQYNFDLALQIHGSGSYINGFSLMLGAKKMAGFFPSGQYCPAPESFLPYQERESEVLQPLRLLKFLGIPSQGEHLEFPIHQADWQEFEAIASSNKLFRAPYICIHPGASTTIRRWSHKKFAAVADALAAQGFQIVLTGTTTEVELTQAVQQMMQYPAINLAGKTSLGALGALLQKSRLLICNDTGISHLAAALKVPSVVIFCNSDPCRWAPRDRQLHRILSCFQVEMQGDEEYAEEPAAHVSHSTLSNVLAEAAKLLHQEVAYAS